MKKKTEPTSLFKQTNFSNTIWWKLKVNISGYQNETGNNLVTEIFKNRIFKLIYPKKYQCMNKNSRILVQFFEDGYICWINLNNLIIEKLVLKETNFETSDYSLIQKRIPTIISWIKDQSKLKNTYLWGGTIGPNYDCSGLIQTAFFKHKIYIPRDAHQIKSFCKHLFNFKKNQNNLQEGDLLFFGNNEKCNHIGIYIGDGLYYHCSGTELGRNGIGIDTINNTQNKVSRYYKSNLISAGRVTRSYRWDKTIR